MSIFLFVISTTIVDIFEFLSILCHIIGNSSICISKQGYENGHSGRHKGDHLGACNDQELED